MPARTLILVLVAVAARIGRARLIDNHTIHSNGRAG